MTLNAFLSRNGFCSRRKAVLAIREGKVTVNGKPVLEPWYQVKDGDVVRAGGKPVGIRRHVYIVMNKPKGVVSTLEDKYAAKKVVDLIPAKFGRVYPVGRLDKDSRGLMILTSDGNLCYKLTHPKYGVEKEYIITVKGEVGEAMLKKIRKGVKDQDDLLKVRSASVEKASPDKSFVRAVVCEGKKRHLRRLFACLGLEVRDLVRIRIANLRLGDLRDGKFRLLDKKELVAMLGADIE
jgi:23S rRNA pseudouridine2605 synthase